MMEQMWGARTSKAACPTVHHTLLHRAHRGATHITRTPHTPCTPHTQHSQHTPHTPHTRCTRLTTRMRPRRRRRRRVYAMWTIEGMHSMCTLTRTKRMHLARQTCRRWRMCFVIRFSLTPLPSSVLPFQIGYTSRAIIY